MILLWVAWQTISKRPSPSQHSILWANFLEFAVFKEDGEAVFYVEFISAQDGGCGGFRVGQENTFGYDVSEDIFDILLWAPVLSGLADILLEGFQGRFKFLWVGF